MHQNGKRESFEKNAQIDDIDNQGQCSNYTIKVVSMNN